MIVFTDDLRTRLRASLSRHERREHALDGRRHAAVAVVLVDSDPERQRLRPARGRGHRHVGTCREIYTPVKADGSTAG